MVVIYIIFDFWSIITKKFVYVVFLSQYWFTYLFKGCSVKTVIRKMTEYLTAVLLTLQIVQVVKELREMFKKK